MSSGVVNRIGRVFVSNLPWTVGSTELRAFGNSFGRVSHSSVIFDKQTGLSKGYGFLVFADKEGGEALLRPGNTSHYLEGNYIHCTAAHSSNNS